VIGDRTASAERPPSLLQATLRHWRATLRILTVALVVAAAYASLRSPEYTAQAQLTVTQGDATTNEALAATYSRAATAGPVIKATAKRTGFDPADVGANVSASPVADSSVITLEAESGSAAKAVNLATAVSEALVDYVNRLNRGTDRAAPLLQLYGVARRQLTRAERRQESLQRDKASAKALAQADVAVAEANLRVQSLSSRYRSVQLEAGPAQAVQILTPAGQASSDRSSVLQLAILAGLVLGSLAALGLTALRELRSSP
jgi:uncharacterized protein involved in exopolysaccharide biosynthesis